MSRSQNGIPAARLVIGLALTAMATSAAFANWVASGNFKYQDRPFTTTGFSSFVELAIRNADVEVLDLSRNPNSQVVATGTTDGFGHFSINVNDNSTHAVRIRVLTRTTYSVGGYNVKVVDSVAQGSPVYALSSQDIPSHDPNLDATVDLVAPGLTTGIGEAFNIFDQGILGADMIAGLEGSRPNNNKLVTFQYNITNTSANSSTLGNTIAIRGTSGYDDTVILHEHGHYTGNNYWGDDNTNDGHALADCNQNILLAFDEGRASFWGCAVRRSFGFPIAQFYFRSDGQNYTNSFDLEDSLQYACLDDRSEVAVARRLWDIPDGTATTDSSFGYEDAGGYDALTLSDNTWWDVMAGPARTASTISMEDFWDGWFQIHGTYYKTQMTTLFNNVDAAMAFFPDAQEPNQTSGTAKPFPKGSTLHLTFFSDPDGDGKGAADTADWFSFSIKPGQFGQSFTVRVSNPTNNASPSFDLIDSNGSTVLATSTTEIQWITAVAQTFYVKVTNTANNGIYGSYDLYVGTP